MRISRHKCSKTPASIRVWPSAFDLAGNMLTKTDARDKVAKYTYDLLNRVKTIKYFPTTANATANTSADETVTYTYDVSAPTTSANTCGAGSKGKLCTVVDKSGTTSYGYDLKGRLISKAHLVASLTQTHSYAYTAAGQLSQFITASGQVISYSYTNNKVVSININGQALAINGGEP